MILYLMAWRSLDHIVSILGDHPEGLRVKDVAGISGLSVVQTRRALAFWVRHGQVEKFRDRNIVYYRMVTK